MSKKIIIGLLVGVWACIGTNAWADQWQHWDYDDFGISVNLFSTASEATCTEDTEDKDCVDDGLFCTGEPATPFCQDIGDDDVGVCTYEGDPCEGTDKPFCIEADRECVECRTTADCAAGEICDDGVCVEDAECVDDKDCEDGVCVEGVCVDCREAADCDDDGLYCTGDPVCTGNVCGFTGNPCAGTDLPFCLEDDGGKCVECLSNEDCDDGEFCSGGVCLTECTLSILPANVRSGLIINRLRVFQITGATGAANFNPLAGVEFDDGNWPVLIRAPSGRSVLVIVSVPPALESGTTIPVRVGFCEGEIRIR